MSASATQGGHNNHRTWLKWIFYSSAFTHCMH